VQTAERSLHYVPGHLARKQTEQRWRDDEGEEDDPADPDHKREQHQEAEEGHVRIISRAVRHLTDFGRWDLVRDALDSGIEITNEPTKGLQWTEST
jgi:hypothetical protein